MFGYHLHWIRHHSDEIARALRGVDHIASVDNAELRKSAALLREAADNLDAIRLRQQHITLVAAE